MEHRAVAAAPFRRPGLICGAGKQVLHFRGRVMSSTRVAPIMMIVSAFDTTGLQFIMT
jgi:hypothetical protein